MASAKTPTQDMGEIVDWFEFRPINLKNRKRQAELVHDRLPFVGIDHIISPKDTSAPTNVKMLDYACGPGFLSRILGPHVSSIHGVDTSPIMIQKFIDSSKEFSVPADKITALTGNLLVEPAEPATLDSDEYRDFDIITVGAALHHFPSTEESLRILGKRLKPGGVLFISDLHDERKEITDEPLRPGPKGFKEAEFTELMKKAGLVDIKFDILPESLNIELLDEQVLTIECFIGTAKRPVE